MSRRTEMNAKVDKSKFDLDRTGTVTADEIARVRDMVEVEILGQRAHTQKKMAWAAMISMLLFTLFLFSSWVTDSRVEALADLLGLFFIAQAGIVGAYMGVTAWMSHTNRGRLSEYTRKYPQDGE